MADIDNRITRLFQNKGDQILNVYFTAGYPTLDATQQIIRSLTNEGVDLIEVGIPYSDPLADGKTIQDSSQQALRNGISLRRIFDDIKACREAGIDTPIVLMGYYNQMLQFGEKAFLDACQDSGVDGLIIPDLPMSVYESRLKDRFERADISMSFLVTPETSDERIRQADQLTNGFIYVVSQSSITGKSGSITDEQLDYFKRLDMMDLSNPRLIGFGISDRESFLQACAHASGAIIGSAYIRSFSDQETVEQSTRSFICSILD